MPHVPRIIMNNEEWYNLLNVLYKLGILSEYLADLDNYENVEVEFNNYFDINSEHCVKIDPTTLRITHLGLDMIYDVANNRVPSIIDQFQSLESIDLENCGSLTMELGNLPVLKTITFCACTTDMFENVPEGLQLSSIKKVIIYCDSNTTFKSNLSSFLKIFSNTLIEELKFALMTGEDSAEILRVLQNDDLCFRHSLTTMEMSWCQLNEDDLELLLFEIRERFPNLHSLDIRGNNIKSLCGIGDRIKRIKQDPLIPDNKLRKLNLSSNPIFEHVFEDGGDEKDALVTLLDKYGLSNLGAKASHHQKYEPKIEYKLRINLAGSKELMDKPIMNRALWPLILERAYNNSSEIYTIVRNGRDTVSINQEVESKKCASGLFYLLKEWKILDGSSTTTNITNDNSSEGSNNKNTNNNNTNNSNTRHELKGKRKRK